MNLISKKTSGFIERNVKIVQFGEGNFLRGFVDYMIDIANEKGLFNGNVVLVKPISFGDCEQLKRQECQYTVLLRGLLRGEEYKEIRRITSCSDIVSPYIDYSQYITLAELDSLEFIVSNTTEAGIVFEERDKWEEKLDISFPAKLTQFLKRRYDFFKGDFDKGLVMLPVELIDNNGKVLKECVLKYIDLWGLEDGFRDWINQACVFANTLVDRIVTGYPVEEAEELCRQFGYWDERIVTAEPFALWVIEAEKDIRKKLPLDLALVDKDNMQVIFTDNQKPYKQRKVRILNGAHTSFCLLSYLAGNDYVKESLEDELVRNFVNRTIYDEIIPTLELPKEDLEDFAGAVLERFRNPFIKHQLLAISLNSVAKFKARCLPSLLGYYERYGCLPKHLTFALAALLAFYTGREMNNGALTGKRQGKAYQIKDDVEVLQFFQENSGLETSEYVKKYLGNVKFHDRDLNEIAGLHLAVSNDLESIRKNGMRKALEILEGEGDGKIHQNKSGR